MASQPKFSMAPPLTVHTTALKESRFLVPERRLLPFRDEKGRINVGLVELASRMVREGRVSPSEEVKKKLERWAHYAAKFKEGEGSREKWARRAASDGSAVYVSSSGEERRELATLDWAPTGSHVREMKEAKLKEAARAKEGVSPLEHQETFQASRAKSNEKSRAVLEALRAQAAGGGGSGDKGSDKRARDGAPAAARDDERDDDSGEEEVRKKRKKRKEHGKRGKKGSHAELSEAHFEEEEEMASDDDDDDDDDDDEEEEDEEAEAVERVLSRCGDVAETIRDNLAPLAAMNPDDDAASGVTAQPASLSAGCTLLPHQRIGLSWLHGLHEQKMSGILADEMGLGKTVQASADHRRDAPEMRRRDPPEITVIAGDRAARSPPRFRRRRAPRDRRARLDARELGEGAAEVVPEAEGRRVPRDGG